VSVNQPASLFLQYPGLLPFAVLGQSESPAEMLRQATKIMDQIKDPTTQSNLMTASAILAGLRLEEDVIESIPLFGCLRATLIPQPLLP
jgi:hypothetical protein